MAPFTTEVTTLNDYSYILLYFVCKFLYLGSLYQQKLQSEPNNVVMADITMSVRNLYYVVVKIVVRLLFGSFYSNTY